MPILRNKRTGWQGSCPQHVAEDRLRYPDEYELVEGEAPSEPAPGEASDEAPPAPVEPAEEAESEAVAERSAEPEYVGGGMYLVDGEKVRGKDAAYEAAGLPLPD